VADFGSGWRHGIGKFRNLQELTLRHVVVADCLSATLCTGSLSAFFAAEVQMQK
jgi:hypothetical protein